MLVKMGGHSCTWQYAQGLVRLAAHSVEGLGSYLLSVVGRGGVAVLAAVLVVDVELGDWPEWNTS